MTDRAAYRTIVADPPWHYGSPHRSRSRTPGKWNGPVHNVALPYHTMTTEAIARLPVGEWADWDARLFLWTTNRHLLDALSICQTWGFTYRQLLTWEKPDAFLGSVAPNSEFIIVANRHAPARTGMLASSVVRHPTTKSHSTKPDIFLDLIESVSPGPYLELFARRQRLGWDTWGNEALEHVEVDS